MAAASTEFTTVVSTAEVQPESPTYRCMHLYCSYLRLYLEIESRIIGVDITQSTDSPKPTCRLAGGGRFAGCRAAFRRFPVHSRGNTEHVVAGDDHDRVVVRWLLGWLPRVCISGSQAQEVLRFRQSMKSGVQLHNGAGNCIWTLCPVMFPFGGCLYDVHFVGFLMAFLNTATDGQI